MKVKELIKILSEVDEDLSVFAKDKIGHNHSFGVHVVRVIKMPEESYVLLESEN